MQPAAFRASTASSGTTITMAVAAMALSSSCVSYRGPASAYSLPAMVTVGAASSTARAKGSTISILFAKAQVPASRVHGLLALQRAGAVEVGQRHNGQVRRAHGAQIVQAQRLWIGASGLGGRNERARRSCPAPRIGAHLGPRAHGLGPQFRRGLFQSGGHVPVVGLGLGQAIGEPRPPSRRGARADRPTTRPPTRRARTIRPRPGWRNRGSPVPRRRRTPPQAPCPRRTP